MYCVYAWGKVMKKFLIRNTTGTIISYHVGTDVLLTACLGSHRWATPSGSGI